MWLGRYDIARRTVTKSGVTRFIAVCLLTGYLWMSAAGLLLAEYGGQMGGFVYDVALHALFVGFVMAMIFGHAPIIFPSVLKLPISYQPIFYGHLTLLHLSLLIRLIGDMWALPGLRRWGGLLNAVTILLFLGNTIHSVVAVRGGRGHDETPPTAAESPPRPEFVYQSSFTTTSGDDTVTYSGSQPILRRLIRRL